MPYTDKEKAEDAEAIGKQLQDLAVKNKQGKMVKDLQEENVRLRDLISGRKKKGDIRRRRYPGLKTFGSKPSTPI